MAVKDKKEPNKYPNYKGGPSNTRLEMPNMFIAEENRKDNERLQMVWI